MNNMKQSAVGTLHYIFLGGLVVLLLAGCDSTSQPTSSATPTENEVLTSLNVSSHLAKVAETAQDLDKAVKILCEKKDDASLQEARAVWKKAYLAWRQATPFLIGPAAPLADHLGKPTNDAVLKGVVESENLASMGKGRDARGYGGVEYLLFIPSDGALATADFRCYHLLEITAEIAQETSRAHSKWLEDFQEGFVLAGNGQPYLVPGDALSLVVAEVLNSLETVLRDFIYLPSNFSGKNAKPELLEAVHSKSTRAALHAFVVGLENALTTGGDKSIAQLVASKDGLTHKKDPKLANLIRQELANIQDSLGELRTADLELFEQLENNQNTLKKIYNQMQKLQESVAQAVLVLELDIRHGLEKDLTD